MQAMLKYCCILCLITLIECEMEGFIVGGKSGNIEKFPHSAFLGIHCVTKTGQINEEMCGSSILNQDILLTAAHCLANCYMSSEIIARVGHVDRNKGSMSSVYRFIVHGHYNADTLAFDIALVKLKTQLALSQNVGRVALKRNPPFNKPAKVAGWGYIDETNKDTSDIIKYIKQRVWTDKDCEKILEKPYGTFCASADNAGDYASVGDSGSALVVRGYIQIGLVSFKMSHDTKYLNVYTDVSYHYDWINRFSKKIYCD